MLNSNHSGSALGLTLATFFTLCSLVFVAWPSGYMAATSMLFHGFALDQAPHAMNFATFITGLICISIVGYVVGTVYALIFNAIAAAFQSQEASLHLHR